MGKDWFDQLIARSGDFTQCALENTPMCFESRATPIENMMGVALWAWCGLRFPEFRCTLWTGRDGGVSEMQESLSPSEWGVVGYQIPIEEYVADFVLVYRHGLSGVGGTVIECDGHDFHERTKEQAAHDKRRDRHMQGLGLKVLRFTGSEVWADPFGCALTALNPAYEAAFLATNARRSAAEGDIKTAVEWLGDTGLAQHPANEPF
jgi:hypothetical protein